jgi:Rod binding domain-containing protein
MNTTALPAPATIAPRGLPVASVAHEPAAVREGSPSTKQAYAAALDFETMLVQQLTQSLAQTSGLAGGEEAMGEGSDGAGSAAPSAGSSVLASLLPQTLAEGVVRSGGFGLAAQLMGALDHSAAGPQDLTGATGGVSA